MTILEHTEDPENVKVSFLGDATNVCNSLVLISSKLGFDVSVANPEGYIVDDFIQEAAKENAKKNDSNIEFIRDPEKAVKTSEFVYTDLWWWVTEEDEAEERKKAMKPYQVNPEMMKNAKDNAKFMHCLPASRGREVVDEVIDAPYSVVYDQAENRQHAHKAIMAFLMQDSKRDVDPQKEEKALEHLEERIFSIS